MKNNSITISAKNLGQLALPNFCERCFWIKMKAGRNIPFQIFPGIFSSIDSYSKKMIHGWFDRHGSSPVWLEGIGKVIGYDNPPHWSKFIYFDKESGVTLRGSPDAIFVKPDKTRIIADYKTAKYTQTQDDLLPMYEIQLNSYALIGQHQGMDVSELALIYTEPVTTDDVVHSDDHHGDDGFTLKFSAHIKPITLETDRVTSLLKQVREIHDMEEAPTGNGSCKDCVKLDGLVDIVNNKL